MFDSPQYLIDLCLSSISKYLFSCRGEPNDEDIRTIFHVSQEKRAYPSVLSEKILCYMSMKRMLSDEVALLFSSSATPLTAVRVVSADNLSSEGLQFLKHHSLNRIECPNLNIRANTLLECLSEKTIAKLSSLNVTRSRFTFDELASTIPLKSFASLTSLSVSGMTFDDLSLELVAAELPNIDFLDISCTQVRNFLPILKFQGRLKHLDLYNLIVLSDFNSFPPLLALETLEYFDIAIDPQPLSPDLAERTPARTVTRLLSETGRLLKLRHLDLSGHLGFTEEMVADYLSTHKGLRFLGLQETQICWKEMFTDPEHEKFPHQVFVAGTGSAIQIMSTLSHYLYYRPQFMERGLSNLIQFSNYRCPAGVNVNDLLESVMNVLEREPHYPAIHSAGSACLYNLSKGILINQIHPTVLKRMVHVIMNSMHAHRTNGTVQRNLLRTMLCHRIVVHIPFNRYRCMRLIYDNILRHPDCETIRNFGITVCAGLVKYISDDKKIELSECDHYLDLLYRTAKSKMVNLSVVSESDAELKNIFVTLWTLSEIASDFKTRFVYRGGLDLCLTMLGVFKGDSKLETNVLGFLYNVVELDSIAHRFRTCEFILILVEHMYDAAFEVAYLAGGVLARVLVRGDVGMDYISQDYRDLEQEAGRQLREVFLDFKYPENAELSCQSFKSCIDRLGPSPFSGSQIWSLSAMAHCCRTKPETHCPMMVRDGVMTAFDDLLKHESLDERVKEMIADLTRTVESYASVS